MMPNTVYLTANGRLNLQWASLSIVDLTESQLGNPETREKNGWVWKIKQNTQKIRPGRNKWGDEWCRLHYDGSFINVTDKRSRLTSKYNLVWCLRVEVGVTYSCEYWQSSCHQCKVWIEFRNSSCLSHSTEVAALISPLKCCVCLFSLHFLSLSLISSRSLVHLLSSPLPTILKEKFL